MKISSSDAMKSAALIDVAVGEQPTFGSFYARRLKRIMDVIGAMMIALLLLPLVIVVYVAVRLDGGAGFYGHTRVGKGGRTFRCWKMRTMVPDADEVLRAHLAANPDAAAQWSAERKLNDDPRITRWGGFLRRTSLDELPQLWNVALGEMSLVGPRPVTLEELEHYGAYKDIYLTATPGMTGLWQVSGRNAVSYQRRVALDVTYVRNLNFLFDLSILLRTARAVLRGTGR